MALSSLRARRVRVVDLNDLAATRLLLIRSAFARTRPTARSSPRKAAVPRPCADPASSSTRGTGLAPERTQTKPLTCRGRYGTEGPLFRTRRLHMALESTPPTSLNVAFAAVAATLVTRLEGEGPLPRPGHAMVGSKGRGGDADRACQGRQRRTGQDRGSRRRHERRRHLQLHRRLSRATLTPASTPRWRWQRSRGTHAETIFMVSPSGKPLADAAYASGYVSKDP